MLCKIKVRLCSFDHSIDCLWLHKICLIETKNHRQSQARNLFQQGQISMGNSLRTVNHKKHNWPGIFKHCIGLIVGDFFYSMSFSFLSNSCSIINGISLSLRLKLSYNIISGCSKFILNLSKLFPYKRIEKCRLSCIWFSYNSKSNSIM